MYPINQPDPQDRKGENMTFRELLRKPFWTPKDLSLATGISVSKARSFMRIMQMEIAKGGYLNMACSKVPTKVVIDRFQIDLEFIEKNGGLDVELDPNKPRTF